MTCRGRGSVVLELRVLGPKRNMSYDRHQFPYKSVCHRPPPPESDRPSHGVSDKVGNADGVEGR